MINRHDNVAKSDVFRHQHRSHVRRHAGMNRAAVVSPASSVEREQRLIVLARAQRGLARVEQLQSHGYARSTIADRVRCGRWQRVHRGVVFLGMGPIPRESRWLAAVLATGDRAALSGEAALEHLGLLRWKARSIDVTVDRVLASRHRGFTAHRTRVWPSSDRRVHHGIVTMSPSRAIVDAAGRMDSYDLIGVLDQAARRSVLDLKTIKQRGRELRNAPGYADLVLAIEHYLAGSRGPRSNREVRLARAIKAAGMPSPYLNVSVATPRGPHLLDLWWPRQHCCVELDDHGHDQPHMIAADSERELALIEARVNLLRVPNEAVDQFLGDVLDRVEMLLRRNGWRGSRHT